jgi:hypothetical protein
MTLGAPGPTDGSILYSNSANPEGNINAVLNRLFLLIDNATATDEGHWVKFTPFTHGTIEITGSGTFSVQLYGKMDDQQPPDEDDSSNFKIGSAITAAGLSSFNTQPVWIKAQLNSISGMGASVTVKLNAFAP